MKKTDPFKLTSAQTSCLLTISKHGVERRCFMAEHAGGFVFSYAWITRHGEMLRDATVYSLLRRKLISELGGGLLPEAEGLDIVEVHRKNLRVPVLAVVTPLGRQVLEKLDASGAPGADAPSADVPGTDAAPGTEGSP